MISMIEDNHSVVAVDDDGCRSPELFMVNALFTPRAEVLARGIVSVNLVAGTIDDQEMALRSDRHVNRFGDCIECHPLGR